jgi:hypothetical protein
MTRTARAVLEPGQALLFETAHPAVRALAGDPHGPGYMGNRHALDLDTLDEELATPRGQSGITVRH